MRPEMLSPEEEKPQWKFRRIGSFGVSGLYSLSDLQSFYRSLQYPQTVDTAVSVVTSRSLGASPTLQGLSPQYIISMEELEERASNVFYDLLGGIREFGIYSASVYGIMFLINIIKRGFTTFVNGRLLLKEFGVGLRLIGALFTSVTLTMIRSARREEGADIRPTVEDRDDDEQPPVGPPSAPGDSLIYPHLHE